MSTRIIAYSEDLKIGKERVYIDGAKNTLEPGRVFASFKEAKFILKPGTYWISSEGVPKEDGIYNIEKDTLTKVAYHRPEQWGPWLERVYISPDAARVAAEGSGLVLLEVFKEPGPDNGRLLVNADRCYGYPIDAYAASVPQASRLRRALNAIKRQ